MYEEGFLQSFHIQQNIIEISLRFFRGYNSLENLKIISKHSYKKYLKYTQISKIKFSKTIMALSTDIGVLNVQNCKINKIGGKVLFIC